MAALHAHTAEVTAHPLVQGGDIDFKLATSGGSRNEATRSETKMDRLVIRVCEVRHLSMACVSHQCSGTMPGGAPRG